MSFNWLGVFRVGSYRAFRTFSMHELRSAQTRIDTIDRELSRIGCCTITYHPNPSALAAGIRMTERRKSFSVTPNTSLEKLVQAYVALGGNPFDISMFLNPRDGIRWSVDEEGNNVMDQVQPHGGTVYPMDRAEENYRDGGLMDLGGHIPLLKNPKGRIDLNEPWAKAEGTATNIRAAREWLNQPLREKRNNLEWQIIKLMDLREQLEREKDLIRLAAGGFVTGIDRPAAFPEEYTLSRILQRVDGMFFPDVPGEDGVTRVDRSRLARGVNDWLMDDFLEEVYTAL